MYNINKQAVILEMLKFEMSSLRAGTHWQQSRKDVRHSGDKNHTLSTKSTELNTFNFGDNVDGDKLAKNRRQTLGRLLTLLLVCTGATSGVTSATNRID